MSGENVALAVFVVLAVLSAASARAFFRRMRAGGGGARTRRALVAGNLLVLATLLSFTVLAGELWFRFAYDATDSFDATRASSRWFERHYKLNSDSFRDDVEYDLGPVPAGRRRVTFVGDSFTAGQGVADVSDRFANRVRAARPGWDVHVFAINGWDTGPELAFLEKTVPQYTKGRYGLDEVVLVYCLNDICDVVPGMSELGERIRRAHERGVLAQSSWLFDMIRFLWVASTDDEIRGYFPQVQSAHLGAAWEKQALRLTEMRDFVASHGGRLSVVTWPMLHRLGKDYPFRETHERLDAFWKSQGVAHLDLLGVFGDGNSSDLVVNRFDAHPNEQAHRIASDAIRKFLDAEMARAK
jgi:hypothetical protein